jgi:hypothetical protein
MVKCNFDFKMIGWKPIPRAINLNGWNPISRNGKLTGWKPIPRKVYMAIDGVFRRRHLPHWDVEDQPIFITACLEGSISAAGLSNLRKYRNELDQRPKPDRINENEWEYKKQKLIFRRMDELLDFKSHVRHLEDDCQAEIVQDAFLHFADERYDLLGFVVMPSHHHWVFLPDEAWSNEAVEQLIRNGKKRRTPREIISHSIQSYTGTMCNRIRNATGSYWQVETFDHWIRDDDELLRVITYIENNPVAAGLVPNPEDWKWSSARIRKLAGLKPGEPIRKCHVG